MNTYTKLRDGWGIRVDGKPQPGEIVTVLTKAGASKTETISKVIWTGPDKFRPGTTISLCAIQSSQRQQYTSYAGSSDVYHRRNGTRGVRGCSECRNLGDICPRCRFDEDDC